MEKISFVNGTFIEHDKATIHIEDRGYQFSDGVYEVILIKNKKLIDAKPHYNRLIRSLSGIKIDYKITEDFLKNTTLELLDKNNLESGYLYLQISRGVAPRKHDFPKSVEPSIVMTVSPESPPTQDNYTNGVAVISYPEIRWLRRDLKTISLLPNILAKQEAVENNVAEAIFVEEKTNIITEGSSTNFFIIDKNNEVVTHPANNNILNGITRSGVINTAKQIGLKVNESPFTVKDVKNATSAFITSTTKLILPVTTFDETLIGEGVPDETLINLMRAYSDYVNNQATAK